MRQSTLKHSTIRLFVLAALLAIAAFAACSRQPPAPTPAATAAPPAAQETAAPATTAEAPPTPAADVWAAVRERGRLVVGTSADYPPFVFYTEAFELSGYDIALARALAQRLGVEVEFKDMAFDGLTGALLLGQIDAAIAAISVTDERRAQADFSNVYFASEGAALARADAGITIDGVDDLAPHRVGVQRGSVYQTWLEEAAVGAGLLPPDNLLVYGETDQAVNDLREGLVDVLIADILPLELAAQDGTLAIAGRGLNHQRFAVAVARDSTLLAPINEALFELQSEGELARLAQEYLDLDQTELQPLPAEETPEAPAFDASRAFGDCIDAMTLIAHLTLDDDGMRSPPPVAPGTPFQKSWRIQNNGTCTWTTGYVLTHVGGNVPQAGMGGAATALTRPVAPGETYDMTVNLVSPLAPGVYQSFWSMRAPTGLLFGDRIWAGITVPAQPTPTPPPTATVSPSISFTVDRANIRSGECVTFSWNVGNGGAVFFHAQGQPFDQNPVAAAGSQTECPPVTTFYELRVLVAGAAAELRSLRIDVEASPNAPFFDSFTVTPGQQITAGQCVDVRWRISGEVTSVRVTRNDTVLWNSAPLRGTSRDCPPVGEAVYSIEAAGPGGTSRALENVTVLAAAVPGATPSATPSGQPATINTFIVSPERIFAGACVTVAWTVSGNVQRVQLRRDGVLVLDFGLFSGNLTDCLSAPGNYIYQLDAINAQGQVTSRQVTATVVR